MYRFEIEPGLSLKPLELKDAEPLYELIDQSRLYLRTYLSFIDQTQSPMDTNRFVNNTVRDNALQQAFVAVIMVDEQIAGLVGMNQINWLNKTAEIGYWLGEPFINQGVMTKAVQAIIDYGFNQLGLNRMELRATTNNKASRRVAEKLNFVQEGIIREDERLHDHFVDHVLYGILKREWQSN